MPPGKATVWSKYLRTLKRRRLLNLTLEQKVSLIVIFLFWHDSFCVCVILSNLLSCRYLRWLLAGSEVKQRPGLLRLGDRGTDPPHRDPTQTCGSYCHSSHISNKLCTGPFFNIISCLSVFRSSGLTLGSLCLSLQMSLSLCCATSQREWQQPWSLRKPSQKMG